jgi:hypothetical protein
MTTTKKQQEQSNKVLGPHNDAQHQHDDDH